MRTGLVAGLAFCALRVYAFDGIEHENISNTALKAAQSVVIANKKITDAIDTFKTPPSFGDVTEAVDWYRSPEDFLNAKDFAGAVRHRNFILKGIAAHQNAAHFQKEALGAWCDYHEQAIRMAHADLRRALLREAVALHYLQDFLAAGHLVTPRSGMHDAVAGDLHNKFNRDGLMFKITGPLDEEASLALEKLQGEWVTSADMEAFQVALATEGKFHGDDILKDTSNHADAGAQKVFITLVSTRSVAEVLQAAVDGSRRGLQTCFALRSAEPSLKDGKATPYPNYETACGPNGGVRFTTESSTSVPQAVECDGQSWFGRYDALDEKSLKGDFYDLNFSGMTLRGETAFARSSRGPRINVDLLFFLFAADPPNRFINRATKEPFNLGGVWNSLRVGAVGISRSHGDGYHATGILYDFYQATPWRAVSWGFRVAPRRYTYQDTHHWKWDIGLKGTLGLDVISIGVSVERARHFDALGRFRPTYFGSIGVESSAPFSWIHKGH